MAVTVTEKPSVSVAMRFAGAINDRVDVYDSDDAAGSPSVTNPGLAFRVFDITFDSSYPNTGGTVGEPLVASTLGFSSIVAVICNPLVKSDQSDAYHLEYDYTAGTLKAYRDAASNIALVQVPNATSLASYTARILVFGHRTEMR